MYLKIQLELKPPKLMAVEEIELECAILTTVAQVWIIL